MLQATATTLLEILNDADQASFEKGATIRENLKWVIELFCPLFIETAEVSPGIGRFVDVEVAAWLCLKILNAPGPEIILALSDLSLAVFERSLFTATSSGILALLLGYTDPEFLKTFVSTVFAAEWGVFQGGRSAPQSEIEKILATANKSSAALDVEKYRRTCELLRSGNIPGIKGLDHRLGCLLSQAPGAVSASDPLLDIFRFAKILVGFQGRSVSGLVNEVPKKNSVSGKLKCVTNLLWPPANHEVEAA